MGGKKLIMETPTRGEEVISVDETLAPILKEEIDVFNFSTPEAHVSMNVRTEVEVYRDLMADSVDVIVGTRKLRPDEEAALKRLLLKPITVQVGWDALAFMVNRENPVKDLTMAQLRDVLSGKVRKWSDLDKEGADQEIVIVFDHPASSTMRWVKDSVLTGAPLTDKVYSSRSNEQVMEYLRTQKYAIGIVGMNWVCNVDDSTTSAYLEEIRPLRLEAPATTDRKGEFFAPLQAPVAERYYPVVRPVYMINREGQLGLGTGFVNFVAGDRGQRVIQKAGLLPFTLHERFVRWQED
jgi:phosphate transport system substrate-binding protein